MSLLEIFREEINDIDYEILKLVAKRIETAKQIGLEKKRLEIPIVDEKVEIELLKKNRQNGQQLGLDEQLLSDLTKLLIKYSVQAQKSR